MNKQSDHPYLYIALPVMDEGELLPRLISCIQNQTYRRFKLFVIVNQPDDWWYNPDKHGVCLQNLETIEYLAGISDFPMHILDRAKKGKGWKGKNHGVGWARKTVMDAISKEADESDIIISLDADTTFSENYFLSIAENFYRNPDGAGLIVPYFHLPPPDLLAYRAILRYEIYMRYYVLNLWRIGCPYTFSALGSAMAFPVWAYKAVGGLTPKMSGEDFYFLQKLRKYGKMLFWNDERVYPEARFSERVYFGTGPAMIKGRLGDWSSYPIYPYSFFDEIEDTYKLFPAFFEYTEFTPITDFIADHLGEMDPWEPLRQNYTTVEQFVRACHEKFDGLRVLQYLKSRNRTSNTKDEANLADYLEHFHKGEDLDNLGINWKKFSFTSSPVEELEKIRTFLSAREDEYRFISTLS